ncbi:MAG: Hydrogenase-4 component A [Syntrophorhabdaceae bacterium PtaU1.Bin034]|nr:MAG: Hydrogenase-4 component A [Syntrophorhabdaceae bacterium PtaU1.Bin034]
MSTVYFTDLRTRPKRNLLDKIDGLIKRMKINKKIKKNDLVAIKLHFGEQGNCAFLRPVFLRTVAEQVKALGARPFLTDTNTLYTGSRSNGVSHITTAIQNGFDYAVIGCPIIIADGLRGSNGVKIPIGGEVLDQVNIAKEIADADALIVVTHFKGHELSGFGGALKNMGMGCATREGKLVQHSTVGPKINVERCKGCSLCLDYCPANAISVKNKRAVIEGHSCIGCGECTVICPQGAIEIQWNEDQDKFQKKMVEHAAGTLKDKEDKAVFLNFLMQVSPCCDCYPHNDAPIVRDIGILASLDPVAIDAASVDLVNAEESMPGTAIKHKLKAGDDKFRALYPGIDWNVQLDHAEKLKMGERKYQLVKV